MTGVGRNRMTDLERTKSATCRSFCRNRSACFDPKRTYAAPTRTAWFGGSWPKPEQPLWSVQREKQTFVLGKLSRADTDPDRPFVLGCQVMASRPPRPAAVGCRSGSFKQCRSSSPVSPCDWESARRDSPVFVCHRDKLENRRTAATLRNRRQPTRWGPGQAGDHVRYAR